MSINKLISIKNAILDATDMLALDHASYLPLFMTWATYAEKEIGGANVIRKRAVLDICGCTASLPDDCAIVEGCIIGNHGTDCCSLFNNTFGAGNIPYVYGTNDSPFLIVDVFPYGGNACHSIVNYGYQDGKLLFDSCTTQTHVTIQYLGYEVDCDGFIMIGVNHVEAITEFLTYKWLKRKRKKSNVELNEMNLAKSEWSRLCAHARAEDRKLTSTQRSQVGNIINDPLAGRSLSLGMKTNNEYGISY